MPEKTAQCRYTQKLQRCPNPSVDPIGEVLLCLQHLARTVELLKARGFTITPPKEN